MNPPRVALTGGGVLAVGVVGLVVLVAGVAWWNRKAIGGAVGAVGQAVNPLSDQNLAYRGVNAIGSSVTGDGAWSLGGAVYEATHEPDGTPKTVNQVTGFDFGAFGRVIDSLAGRTPLPTTGDLARADRLLDASRVRTLTPPPDPSSWLDPVDYPTPFVGA